MVLHLLHVAAHVVCTWVAPGLVSAAGYVLFLLLLGSPLRIEMT